MYNTLMCVLSICHFVTWERSFVTQLKQYGYHEQSSWCHRVVLNSGNCRTATSWMLVCDEKSTENKENRQFCQSLRCPGASTTCLLHCTTFNIDGYSELIIAGVENSNASVGCNPNKMVTHLNWACSSACAYNTSIWKISYNAFKSFPFAWCLQISRIKTCWIRLEWVFNISISSVFKTP